MKINTLDLPFKSVYYKRAMSQKAASALIKTHTKSKESRVDTFIRSSRTNREDSLDRSKTKMLNGMVGNDILDVFNFGEVIPCTNDVYTYKGVSFTEKQIPKVDSSRCKEIKAENNVVTFQKNSYYKYTTKDGKSHCMVSGENSLNTPTSDAISGNTDNISHMTSWFWDVLSGKESAYISLHHSEEKQREYLDAAGVKKGFFTVSVGDSKADHYYSGGDTTIHPRWEYEEQYAAITSMGGLFSEEKPGDIFELDGKEYVLSDKHTLDIPYGADIFNIKYPRMLKIKADSQINVK